MRPILIFILLSLLTPFEALSQTSPWITDVDFRIENNQVIVVYSISNYKQGETYNIRLSFITGDNRQIYPSAGNMFGDVGPGIQGGSDKFIIWNVEKDLPEYSGMLKAVIAVIPPPVTTTQDFSKNVVQEKKKEPGMGGPGYAFLSMILPGTGGYFVEKNSTRAIAFNVIGGAVLASVIVHAVLIQQYNDELASGTSGRPKSEIESDLAYAQETFQTASTVYAVIWLTDVAWVAIKGGKNKRELAQRSGFSLNYSNNQLIAGYRLRF